MVRRSDATAVQMVALSNTCDGGASSPRRHSEGDRQMTYSGSRLTFRQAAAFLVMRFTVYAYIALWVGGFVWVLS